MTISADVEVASPEALYVAGIPCLEVTGVPKKETNLLKGACFEHAY